jgi:YgiT-type zinc finger domain-containing protein
MTGVAAMAEPNCPICGREALERKSLDFETQIEVGRGVTRQLRVPGVLAEICFNCGEAFYAPESQKRIVAGQRQTLGLLSAAQIRELRGKRTQAELCELLGIGEKTYSRWESEDHFQSEAFDRFLRMLMMSQSNWELLEEIARSKRSLMV